MKRSIALATVGAACLLLASCTKERKERKPPETIVEQKTRPEDPAPKTKPPEKPPEKPPVEKIVLPRAFVAELNTEWDLLARDTAKLKIDATKEAFVRLEFWESGKPGKQIATVSQRLIAAEGEIEVATHVHFNEKEGRSAFKIDIGDGVGSSFFYEFPADLQHFLARLPREVSVKAGAASPSYYLLVGKDCTLRTDETVHDLAKRVEYALVLSLVEADKE